MTYLAGFFALIAWALAAEPGWAQETKVAGAVDLIAPMSLTESDNNRLTVRGAELILFGAVDPYLDGALVLAGHEDESTGEFHVAVEEAYLIAARMIPGWRARAGQFLLPIGRTNQLHPHDWAYILAPRWFDEFLGHEPVFDQALEATKVIDGGSWRDITLGVANGYQWNEETTRGRPKHPTGYLRSTWFTETGPGSGRLLGVSYVNRRSAGDVRVQLAGFDATYKQRIGRVLRWFWQNELFYENRHDENNATHNRWGGSSFIQYGADERWHYGLRVDLFGDQSAKNGDPHFVYGLTPTLTARLSEFSHVRAAYALNAERARGGGWSDESQVQLQWVYFLGAHPSHDF